MKTQNYSDKLAELKTPEEIEAFAQELLKSVQEKKQDNLKDIKVSNRNPFGLDKFSPWYDVATNETENMVIDLYAKGLTTRDIVNYLRRNHGIEISQPTISLITDKVFPLVKEWQSRPLSSCYPIVYLDGLHFKVRDTGKIASKVAYIALGINQLGQKEVMGIWISETEGAKFWMHVLNELKNRGVEDILIACVDGLKGFPEAIKAIFPHTTVQLCVVHQIRHTVMFVSHKDREKFCEDLKSVYMATTEDAGFEALKDMQEKWSKYKSYLKSWEAKWSDLSHFFNYPKEVRALVYTTNTIESLNRQLRKVTKTTTTFPHDESLTKLLWLAQADISQKWIVATRNWADILAQLNILYPDRMQF